ncbi:NADH-cytochrome b5 reductase-like [Rhagoletis pomonella]|uniref:NADH-cytochrome b5 reductase-like n=1 Tax=Rhagoletis pomonella TaxID=28610 RepID=UPI00177AA8DE|nr:NADH-cytochrome b5 reductase-like [Rhagoletis pomonella]
MDESDCCGNGCMSCILNVGLRKSDAVDLVGKYNVISIYQKFRLLERRSHNPKAFNSTHSNEDLPKVLELHFKAADLPIDSGDYILDIPVGYHIMMRTKLPNDVVWLRPYSPFWVDALALEFKILVNLSPNGYMSRYISGLQPGDLVEFRGPIGAYERTTRNCEDSCVFVITQGVAIAPTLRIVKRILDNEEDFSRVIQLACYRDLKHSYFRDKLKEFNKYWNYSSRIYLAHQRCSKEMCEDSKCTGKCDWFQSKLWYKELVYSQRLNLSELENICNVIKKDTKLEFVIAGSKKFQEAVNEMIHKSTIEALEENIFML